MPRKTTEKKSKNTTPTVLHSHPIPKNFTLPGPDEFGPIELPHKPTPIPQTEVDNAKHATPTNEDTRDDYVTELRTTGDTGRD